MSNRHIFTFMLLYGIIHYMNNIEKLLKKRELKKLNNLSTETIDNLLMNEFEVFLKDICASEDMELIRREQKSIAETYYDLNNIKHTVTSDEDVTDRINAIMQLTTRMQQSMSEQLYARAELLFTVFNIAHEEISKYFPEEPTCVLQCNKYESAFNDCLLTTSDAATIITNINNMANIILDCCSHASNSLMQHNYSESIQYFNIMASAVFIIYTYAEKIVY